MLTLIRVKLNRINKTYNATFCYTRKCACLLGEGEGRDRDPGCLALLRQGPKGAPGSMLGQPQPGAQARTCHLLCPIFRASMRVLAIIFCHQGHDQDNVWEVKWLRFQLNKKRTFHTKQLSKTSRVIFNEFRFSGTVGQPVEKRDSGTGIFLNRQQEYFKDSFGQGISSKFLHFQTPILQIASSPNRTTSRMHTIPSALISSIFNSHYHLMSTPHSLF